MLLRLRPPARSPAPPALLPAPLQPYTPPQRGHALRGDGTCSTPRILACGRRRGRVGMPSPRGCSGDGVWASRSPAFRNTGAPSSRLCCASPRSRTLQQPACSVIAVSPSGELMSRLVACCWEHRISVTAPARPNSPLPCLPPAAVSTPFSCLCHRRTLPLPACLCRSTDINPIAFSPRSSEPQLTAEPSICSSPAFSDAIRKQQETPRSL